jgi:hypothetical protein
MYQGKEFNMKVKKLVREMYKAILTGDREKEKELWLKTLHKSLDNKNTHVIK